MKMIAFKIEDEIHAQLKHKTIDLNTNIRAYVTRLIKESLKKEDLQKEKE